MMKRIQSTAVFLSTLELWLVALVVVASMGSERALPLALAVAAIFWPIRWLAKGQLTVHTPADWAIGLLALMLPVTLWATPLPETTRPQVYRLLTGIALYYAVVNWCISRAQVRQLIKGTLLAGLFLALSAPLTVSWQTSKLPFIPASLYERFLILLPDTVHSNVMAGSLVILLPLALAYLLLGWQHLRATERLLALLGALVMALILLLTQSRGGLIGLGAAIALLILLSWRRGCLLLLLFATSAAFMVRILGVTTSINLITTSNTLGSLDSRLEVWARTLVMMQDFFFTGIGMGLFGPTLDAFYPLSLASSGTIPHAHNLLLQIAVDLGIFGLIAWLAVLKEVIMVGWQLYREGYSREDKWQAAVGAGLLASQVALMIHGLTDAVTWGMVRPAPIVWGLWGLTIAAWRILGQHSKSQTLVQSQALTPKKISR